MIGNLFHAGTCVRARASDESVTCDDNGNFEPLQCRQLDSKLYSCQCVDPLNNVQQYNSRQVQDLADAPDCDDLGMPTNNNTSSKVVNASTILHQLECNGF